ncbi:MAG: AraC family transcriptional regulator N-terminal domain-containing protein [Granulosicoccus sp.]
MLKHKLIREREILARLTELSEFWDDNATSMLPNLAVFSRNYRGSKSGAVYEPVVCLILQGSKETSIGDQHVKINQGDALLVSHHLPVVSRIVEASADAPYLAILFSLDIRLVRSLYDLIGDAPGIDVDAQSLAVGPADITWLVPLLEYMELYKNPLDAKVLGESISRQIHYRLILSPIGSMLRHLLVVNSHASKIGRAIENLRVTYRSKLSVTDLAGLAGMSVSSFHTHFKVVTGTTPLQFQKDLRLVEAQSILAYDSIAVSDVAFKVGYSSPNQFSRDYRKKFGRAPSEEKLEKRDSTT